MERRRAVKGRKKLERSEESDFFPPLSPFSGIFEKVLGSGPFMKLFPLFLLLLPLFRYNSRILFFRSRAY